MTTKVEMHGTTILAVRKGGKVVVAGDGQVTFGTTVMKGTARKVRTINGGTANPKVVIGFAGSTADAFTLFERFEGKLKEYSGNLRRAAVELAKDWRTDRALRRLEAMLIVADVTETLVVTGSGGKFAEAAAIALARHSTLDALTIATEAMRIAGEICIYTNNNLTIEELG